MSTRYEARFNQLKAANRKAFVPFTLLGWPNRRESFALIRQMIESGASALELGLAFSDPVADGPIIQKAAYETIASDFSVSDAFELLKQVREIDGSIPIGLLVYFNTVLAKGIECFFALAKGAGVDGVLIADLPAENAHEVLPTAKANGVDLIFLVSPVTTPPRLESIVSKASGFLYLVSRLGVTGTGERSTERDSSLSKLVKQIKQMTAIPVCAGFGISGRADAERMFEIGVDGVISGSRVIQICQSNPENSDDRLRDFYAEMLTACESASRATRPLCS